MKTYSILLNGYEVKTDDHDLVAMLMLTDARVSVMLLRNWPAHGLVHLGNGAHIEAPPPAIALVN